MARIAGVDLPRDKRVEIGLTYIYGIGPTLSKEILSKAGIDADIRVRDLSEDDVAKMSVDIIKQIQNDNNYSDEIKIIGPADASLSKANDYYRKVVYLKSENYRDLVEIKDSIEKWSRDSVEYRKCMVYVDFNPQNVY